MGFRDLYSFNLAMLAQQGSRLLQAPESLCAHVMRASGDLDVGRCPVVRAAVDGDGRLAALVNRRVAALNGCEF